MFLAGVEVTAAAALAPMAGVTDFAFRTLCRETAGSLYTTTEMVSAKALCYGDKHSLPLLRMGADEHPAAAQIFGSDPACMAEGALIGLEESGADVIDINMGCPMPKIVRNGDGCALMRNTAAAEAVVREVVRAVGNTPVTVKMRLGWDRGCLNAAELAKRLEAAGASGFCVHGRTCVQRYSGRADWDAVADVVKAVNVPVVVNGDIFSLGDLRKSLRITGAAMGMIGRAAMGNPFVFLEGETALSRRLDSAERHFALLVEDKGERTACLEMRRHLAWTVRGFPGAARLRGEIYGISAARDFARCVKEARGHG